MPQALEARSKELKNDGKGSKENAAEAMTNIVIRSGETFNFSKMPMEQNIWNIPEGKRKQEPEPSLEI